MKILPPIVVSMILLAVAHCGPDKSPTRARIQCRITAAGAEADSLFDTGTFSFDRISASVTSGTSNGLEINATKTTDDGETIIFILHLPAGKEFGVFRDKRSAGYRSPDLPFVINEDYCKDIPPVFGKKDFPYLQLQQLTLRSGDSFSARYIWFERFAMRFTNFRVRQGKLYAKATFQGRVAERHGKMHEAGFRITGELDIHNIPLGMMFVD